MGAWPLECPPLHLLVEVQYVSSTPATRKVPSGALGRPMFCSYEVQMW